MEKVHGKTVSKIPSSLVDWTVVDISHPCPKLVFSNFHDLKLPQDAIQPFSKNEFNFQPDRSWEPECLENPMNIVAIVVGYSRNQEEQLKIMTANLIKILQKQKLHFKIFLIENEVCTLGKKYNIGGQLAKKDSIPFACVVFHPIDFLARSEKIQYSCHGKPRHLGPVKIDAVDHDDSKTWNIE